MTVAIPNVTVGVFLGHDTAYDSNPDPDIIIDGRDIVSLEISSRIGEVMDEFSLSLHNYDGRYSYENALQTGDRLEFRVPRPDGSEWTWTGRVQTTSTSRTSPDISTVDVEGVDYAADIISERKISQSYFGEDVGDIISDILRKKVPEVDPTSVGQLGVDTDVNYSTTDCWDAILKLAARADAVVYPDGRGLAVEPMANLPYSFEIEASDYYGLPSISTNDDIKNIVRVESGVERKLEGANTAFDSFQTVTESDRLTQRVRARKAQLHSIDIWTRPIAEDDSLVVRIQSDEGGAPVAIDDEDSDIESASWEGNNLTNDGWTYFNIPQHTLADRDPWIIVEVDGEGSHDVGINADGDLMYQSYYPFPINAEVQDTESIEEYGPRELQISRDGIKTLTAARDAGYAELARRAWPTKPVQFDANSPRAHFLEPGNRIDINRPVDGIEGEYVVTEMDTTWDSSTIQLQTSITAQWRKGILAEVTRI